jgi:polysaccharide chain length determinant protein (PEP-CTERM system associated)
MNETIHQIKTALREMWHRRWIGVTVAWLAALIGIAVVFRIPERFEASARVFVDTQSLLRPILAGLAIQPNLDQQVQLMSRTLISRTNVEKVVRMADLDHSVRTDAERNALIEGVTKSIALTGSSGANIYQINYRDQDPERARRVVQSLLGIFVESNLGDKQQDNRLAIKFLDDQIRNYEASLQAAENRLKDFRLKYMGVGNRGGDYFARIGALGGQIDQARMELQVAEKQRDSYRKELSGEQPTFYAETTETAAEIAVPEMDARLATLRRDLDEMRRRYTDQHPDVLGTQRIIAQLENERKAEIESRRKAADAAGVKPNRVTDRNPVFQQLRLSLAESEAAVSAARAKLSGYEQQYADLKGQARQVPQIEAEFTQLNRDYDVQKRTYETLLARREQATMGIGMQDQSGAQFRIIDPPRVSQQPVAPNRVMLLGVAFALALGAGVLAAFVASQLFPTFHDSRTLREITQRPVLGMVSQLPDLSVARRRRRGSFLFAGTLTGLVAMYAAVAAFAMLAWRAAQ